MLVPKEIAFPNDRKSFTHFAFITWITQNSKEPKWEALRDAKELDITITVEGVEISYVKFMERIEKHFNELESRLERRIREKAINLLHEAIAVIESEQIHSEGGDDLPIGTVLVKEHHAT